MICSLHLRKSIFNMMSTIFDFIKSILFTKKRIDFNVDDEPQFNAYMLNRWISMYSAEMVDVVNSTGNMYAKNLPNKEAQYEWYFNLFPRMRFKKIQYLKKIKAEQKEASDDNIAIIAKNNEISQRELLLYKELDLLS